MQLLFLSEVSLRPGGLNPLPSVMEWGAPPHPSSGISSAVSFPPKHTDKNRPGKWTKALCLSLYFGALNQVWAVRQENHNADARRFPLQSATGPRFRQQHEENDQHTAAVMKNYL